MTMTALIRKLTILRFRGLEKFEWHPKPGMNVVLGGGDVGKSTVLEAIALLLSPSNATVVSEVDYWQRDSTQEFTIEAVMALPPDTGISTQRNFSWPWIWNGKDAVAPSESAADDLPPDDPVYRVRVRGTTELELVWEIVQPHEEADHFSVAVRRTMRHPDWHRPSHPPHPIAPTRSFADHCCAAPWQRPRAQPHLRADTPPADCHRPRRAQGRCRRGHAATQR